MKNTITILIGAAVGVLDGVGIFYAPGEPYKIEIFLAAILKGVLVSLFVAFALKGKREWKSAALYGVLFGLLFALVIFLAKGGFRSMDAPFVVPSGIVMGAITGILVNRFSLS
jgi:hypothetical protein